MVLINRIARLFKADFHAVLDRIEEPVQLLKQAVRDMEEALAASEQRLELAAQEQESLLSHQTELERRLAELEQELELCFGSGEEQLARGLVRRKLESRRLLERLDARLAASSRQLSQQRSRLVQDRAALETMQQKAAIFCSRTPANGESAFDANGRLAPGIALTDDEIDVAFLREQQARRTS